jgi:hypothetical protein
LTEKLSNTQDNQPVNENDDATLFEETTPDTEETPETNASETEAPVTATTEQEDETEQQSAEEVPKASDDSNAADGDTSEQESIKKEKLEVNQSFDDNFIKKYKAKLQKKAKGQNADNNEPVSYGGVAPAENEGEIPAIDFSGSSAGADATPIESLTQGNITERPMTDDLKNYNDSLDFLDGNVKYSKYVIYIDPENVDFIEGLTVKERKNLINGILRQQNDISITKQRFKVIQTIIRHVIILILTIAIAIPVVYHAINASLEATINNHRNAQTNWQVLYKENGKITRN